MLQVIVYTNQGRQHLDLDPGAALTIEAISPYFVDDLTQDTYSLPIDIPISQHNKMVLGAPEMLESQLNSKDVYFIIDVLSEGLPLLQSVKMSILNISSTFDYSTGTYVCSLSGASSLFGALIRNKMLNTSNILPIINFSVPSRNYAYQVMTNDLHPQRHLLAFAPVHRPSFFDNSRTDYDDESMTNHIANHIVYRPSVQSWQFGAPSEADTTIAAIPGAANGYYAKHRTIPFFKLTAIIKALFKKFGYQVIGTFFDIPSINEIVLDNNQAIEVYRYKNIDLNRKIVPDDHLPDMTIAEFLNEVVKALNLRLTFDNVRKTAQLNTKSVPKSVINLAPFVLDSFELEEFKNLTKKINWSFDTNDEMVSNFIKSDVDARKRGIFNTLAQAQAATFTPALAEDDIIYVVETNYYYVFRASQQKWVYYAEGHNDTPINADAEKLEVGATALLNYVAVDNNTNNVNLNMVSSTGTGSYLSFKFVAINNPCKLKFFMIENVMVAGYPVAIPRSHNRNTVLSLSYSERTIGLYELLFKRWYDRLKNARILKVRMVNSNYTLEELTDNMVQIHNKSFLVKSASLEVSDYNNVELELIKI